MDPIVTVLLPTTGDRAALVEIALRTVLAQTLDAFEVFLVGDGAKGRSPARLEALAEADPRVHVRLFEKGERRGEPNRHRILMEEARGRVVAYITDRDLWLDHHLQAVVEALEDADFIHTLMIDVLEDKTMRMHRVLDLGNARHRRAFLEGWEDHLGIPLSGAAHTLAAYRRLPEGWATTPDGELTDIHMWRKFLQQSWVRARTCLRPTLLRFPRGAYPGPSASVRAVELAGWEQRLEEERARHYQGFYEAAIAYLYRTRTEGFEENLEQLAAIGALVEDNKRLGKTPYRRLTRELRRWLR